MKYKLLAVEDCEEINIGDYIQAVAASQFLPSIDGFVQREHLDEYDEEEAKVIMNGFFMHYPDHWPPSNKIHPLYVSFHINSATKETMVKEDGINHFKKYAPIGCRDLLTKQLLNSKGIDAYFSGCLTLTLGEKYKSSNKKDVCYFVDPYFKGNWSHIGLINNLAYYLIHKKFVDLISNSISLPYPFQKIEKGLRKKLRVVDFCREYSKFFTKETLIKAVYITHESKKYKTIFKTDKERLHEAERLIKLYAEAKLVVTSRIHCALPCLGLGTSVIYVENNNQASWSSCRLDGLRELFNRMIWEKGVLKRDFNINGLIEKTNSPVNKNKWEALSIELKNKVQIFVQKTEL